MYYGKTFRDYDLYEMIKDYLVCRGFSVGCTVLTSTTPQYQLDVKFNQEIWDGLTEGEQQIIRFFFPAFGDDF